MAEESTDKWFSKLAKAARNLVRKDSGVERSFEQLRKLHEACVEGTTEALTGQTLLEEEVEKNLRNIKIWDDRAEAAKTQGNEVLVVQALQRKSSYMQSTLDYESQLPLMRLRRIHLQSRLEKVNTIVFRLSNLKMLLATMPQQADIRKDLLAALEKFLDELPLFLKEQDSPEPSFNKAICTAQERISELEKRFARCASSFRLATPDKAQRLDEAVKTIKTSTRAAIEKVQEHLEEQQKIESHAHKAKIEDAVWEARQMIWSDENTLESLNSSLESLDHILQHQVASPT